MAISTITTCKAALQIDWNVKRAQTGLSGLVSQGKLAKTLSFALGANADQIDEIYYGLATLAASGTTTLTLTGALTDVVANASFTLARVKLLVVQLLGAAEYAIDGTTAGSAATSITIGNAASHPIGLGFDAATDTWTIKNRGLFLIADPGATAWAVGSGASDQFKILNNDSGVSAIVQTLLFGSST